MGPIEPFPGAEPPPRRPSRSPRSRDERGTRRLAVLLLLGRGIADLGQVALYLLAAIGALRLVGY